MRVREAARQNILIGPALGRCEGPCPVEGRLKRPGGVRNLSPFALCSPSHMPDPSRLRPATLTDQGALGRVAYLTGFFDGSAERSFPDPALLADLWVRPSLEETGLAGLVAEVGGQGVGYVLGAPDQRVDTRAPGRRPAPGPSPVAGKPVHPVPGRWRIPAAGAALSLTTRAVRRLPAHLHLNLLPAARGSGLGRRLEGHLHALKAAGVPGVQLSTTRENVAALMLISPLRLRGGSGPRHAVVDPVVGPSS